MLGLTIPHGNLSANLFTSCSAKCLVNVYVFGWSFSSFGVISTNASSVSESAMSITFCAISGAGYKISSASNRNELTYALETCTIELRCFNWLVSSMTRRVPSRFILTVGFKDSLKSSVAAEWNTMLTFSMRTARSAGERPRCSSPTSPFTGISFLKTLLSAVSSNFSNTFRKVIEKSKDYTQTLVIVYIFQNI